jgi:NAD(P)-dependent dehydrogenase (short-subunit alcohol dehydrogenase family)
MKRVFITGGRGDIGQAIAAKFKQQHYEVIAPGSNQLDLAHLTDINAYIQSLPTVDAFIHCAGINLPKPFEAIEFEDLQKTLMINAFSFYKLSQALVTQNKLNEKGHILGLSSIYGDISRKGRFSYTSAKYCMNGMIKNLALELGEKQIKVNGLAPGFVDTKLTRKNNSQETINRLVSSIPLGRMACVNDIAKAAYFFASEENSYINGQIIIADGGYLVGGFQNAN